MAYAKYTFFEAATQHGYVLSLMTAHMKKSQHLHQIIIDPTRGRVFQLFQVADLDKPMFEFVIPERTTAESPLMWRSKAKKTLEGAWKQFETNRALARAIRNGTGGDTAGSSVSTPSNPDASSTPPPTPPDLSTIERTLAEPAVLVSVPSDPTPVSSTPEPLSSKVSARRSRKSGSSSRSSSGA